jgi:hypothetical protein
MGTSNKTRWTTDQAIRVGTDFHDECVRHRTELETRIRPAEIDGLAADLLQLREADAAAVSSRADRRSATVDQNSAMRRAAGCVSAVRVAIRRAYPEDKSIQRSFGVGARMSSGTLTSVAAHLRTVLDAAARHPDAVAAAGILAADVADAQAGLEALASTDDTQERRKLVARQATMTRIAAQRRVEASVDRIFGAAVVAFRENPRLLERFTSLLPSRHRRKPRPTADAPARSTTTVDASPA